MATIKQKLVASKLVENGGNISKSMIEAGYSPATAKTPQKLTESKGWRELMEKYLPDDMVLDCHNKLIKSKNEVVSLGAVNLAYKVKGKFSENTINMGDMQITVLTH